jgi:hypothetical protein
VDTCTLDPETGETVILIINQGLYMGDMLKSSLLTPNQLWNFGIIVDDCPIHLAPDPSLATHSIYSPHDELCIPLQFKGIISCFTSWYPTTNELESCRWIELSSSNGWDPNADHFQEDEERLIHGFADSDHPRNDRTIGTLESIGNTLPFAAYLPTEPPTQFRLAPCRHQNKEAPDALVNSMQGIGIPCELHSDDAKESTEGKMGELLQKFWLKGTQSEPYSPWQVQAELCI